VVATGALLGVGSVAAYAYYARDLPDPRNLASRLQFHSTKIYDRNGVLLYEVFDPNRGRRTEVTLAEIADPMKQAILAAEDARFYQNPGIDPQGIIRAFFENLTSGGTRLSGGSTITQQLVKNTLLSSERTLSRKIKEAILAISISHRYSKDQILEMYLNTVYFGNQAYGVEAAAQTYFGKPASELTLPEAALLAGLVRAPSTTNPFADQQAAKAAQQRVLDLMVRHGFISEAEARAAAEQPLNYHTRQLGEIKAPHFVLWVREQLEANPRYGQKGLYQQGLEVTTTLDIRLQEMAELIVRDHVARLGRFNVRDGALVAINPATGEILAMVGSADYHNKAIQGEVNVALALRQPGSSIKPITYLAAFLKGWTPATIIEDAPTEFPGGTGQPPYRPKNYDGQFHGKVTARTALANSYNIPAVKTLQFVGLPAMIDLARRMGITTFQDPSRYGLSLTLGGGEVRLLELTSAYGVFATGGKRLSPVSILKVTDAKGNVLDHWPGPRPQPVVDAQYAYLITSILSDNEARTPAFGPNSPLRLSRAAAVKTGTTDDFKDNWTIGYTSQLVTGVWVGNADNQPMRGTTGLTGAAPIWHDFMEFALKPLPVDPLAPPPGLARVPIARDSGRLWVDGCPEPKIEEFVVQPPKEKCQAPTPTPVPTEAPRTPTPVPTEAPRATSTPAPSAEEVRARAAATATAAAQAAATLASRQPTAAPTQTAQNRPDPTPTQTGQGQPAPQPPQTQVPAQQGQPSPTPTAGDGDGQRRTPAAAATATPSRQPPGQQRR
jgi:1A family penicillin-binding protein